MLYANEHEPVHVHGKCQGREAKAEIILIDGRIDSIRYLRAAGREMLSERELQYFREIVTARAQRYCAEMDRLFCLAYMSSQK